MSQSETSLTNIDVGDQFGPYKLVGRLGVGGMAETFGAIRTGPGEFTQRVCLKLVIPIYREDDDFVRLFEREARLAAKKMEVTGKLMQGPKKVLGTFTAYRGSYKGKACKSLYRVEQELAKDIALWLEDPGMHDKLGAAK